MCNILYSSVHRFVLFRFHLGFSDFSIVKPHVLPIQGEVDAVHTRNVKLEEDYNMILARCMKLVETKADQMNESLSGKVHTGRILLLKSDLCCDFIGLHCLLLRI